MKLFVIAGHSDQSPGALAYNGLHEHHYTQEHQKLLSMKHRIYELEGSVVIDSKDMNLRRVIDDINANAKRGDYGIDVHFNNNNPGATGVEVFVHPDTTRANKGIATEIVRGISDLTGLPIRRYRANRDYKYPADINRYLAILEETKIPMILVEYCFLTKRDLDMYLPKKKEIAAMEIQVYQNHFKTFAEAA